MGLSLRLICALFLVVSNFSQVLAQESEGPNPKKGILEKSIPIPNAKLVQTKIEYPDEAFEGMWVSHKFKPNETKILSGVDLIDQELKEISDFVADKSIPNSEKFIIFKRYGFSEKAAEALIAAKNAGVGRILIVTDLNNALDGDFEKGEQYHSDLKRAKWNSSGQAKATQALIAAGFDYNNKNFGIYSQPLFNDHDPVRDPLEHEKATLLGRMMKSGKGMRLKALKWMFGSTNMNEPYRYNRTFIIKDETIAKHALEHALIKIAGYSKGKPISQLRPTPPVKFLFGEGGKYGYIWAGYTDGRYELNTMISEQLKKAAAGEFEIKGIYSSNFVDTNMDVMEAERDVLEASLKNNWGAGKWKTDYFAIIDGKFTTNNDFNVTPAKAGFPAIRGGRFIYPFSSKVRELMQVYSYQRVVDGRKVKDPDGAPINQHVWHDKSYVIHTVEADGEWFYIYSGSYNLSTNYHNAENRMVMKIRAEREFAQDFKKSIVQVVENEPEYALRLDREGGMRQYAAQMFDLDVNDISIELIQQLIKAMESADVNEIRELLTKIRDVPTEVEKRAESEVLNSRIDQFMKFVDWYESKDAVGKPYAHMNLVKYASVMMLVMYPKLSDYTQHALLQGIFYFTYAGKTEAQIAEIKANQQRLMRTAWEKLGIPEPYPEYIPKTGGKQDGKPESNVENKVESKAAKKPRVDLKDLDIRNKIEGGAARCGALVWAS
jgi:hypothetical protein